MQRKLPDDETLGYGAKRQRKFIESWTEVFMGPPNLNVRLSLLCIAESQIHTVHSGRKTLTKGSYSSLRVVITEKEYWAGRQGCYPSPRIIPCI